MADTAISKAWGLAKRGDLDEALNLVGSQFDKEFGPTYLSRAMLGAIFVKAGQVERGLMALCVDWTQADADASGLAGAVLFGLARFDEALPALRHAVAGKPSDPGAHLVNLGRTLVYLGQAEEALPYLRRGVAQSTHDQVLAAQALAEALLALGRFEEALAALPQSNEDEEVVVSRAVVLAMSGRHDEAASFVAKEVERAPDSILLLLLQADLAEVCGRTGESINVLRKALEQDPESISLWVRLAHCGRISGSAPHVKEAVDRAMQLAQDKGPAEQALAHCANAHMLVSAGMVAEGQAAYRKALELAPDTGYALSGLGHLLLQNGLLDEAVACFEKLKAIAPLQGWSQLIHARKLPDDDLTLENMERVARQPSLEGPLNSGLMLTVAAAWDKKKNYDRAMTLAREANEAARKLLPYDPAAHRKLIEREIARFSKDFMASRAGWGNPSRLPVFVLGMPRSGTTLTEQILGSHSKVFGAGELSLIPEQIGKLEAWQLKLGSGQTYPECVADLSADMSRTHAGILLERLCAFEPGAQHVVDKLPHNFQHIGLIKLLFPNAVIFHCKREPRDVAVSNYITDYAAKFGGMGFAYDLGWIGAQLVDHDRLMAHWHEVFPGQIFEVSYEELVEDTETWARRMIAFLGLEWEAGVLDFQDLDRPVKTASAWQVRQPIYKTSKERWKRYKAHLGQLEEALSEVPPMPEATPLPSVPPGLFGNGMELLKAGKLKEAEDAFLRLIAAHPSHAGAHHFLGVVQVQQGLLEKAARSMRHSLQLLPHHPSWFENLARAEYALGNIDVAKQLLERSRRMRQPHTESISTVDVAARRIDDGASV